MEAARITATTTNKTINVMPMEAMIAQKRANRIQERRALLVLPGVVGPLPTSTSRTTNRCRRARPHVAWDVAFPVSRYLRACRGCRGIPVASEGGYGRKDLRGSRCRRAPPRDGQGAGRCPA